MKKTMPSEVLKKLQLPEPQNLVKTTSLIQDTKHTNQFSVKLPADIIAELEWKRGDRLVVAIENNKLFLSKGGKNV